MKKIEYQLNSVYDLRVRGVVLFSITLKHLHWQEYSSLDFQVDLSVGAHFYLSLHPTACNIAKSTGTYYVIQLKNILKVLTLSKCFKSPEVSATTFCFADAEHIIFLLLLIASC